MSRTTLRYWLAAGRVVRAVDPDANETATDYNDARGTVTVRQTNVGEPTYVESITHADTLGRTVQVFDANLNPTVYTFDGLSRQTGESTALGSRSRRGFHIGQRDDGNRHSGRSPHPRLADRLPRHSVLRKLDFVRGALVPLS